MSFPSELWSVNFQWNHRGLRKAIQLSARYHFCMDMTILSTHPKAISRAELFWLWGAILFGSIIRLSYPSRMAVEHFDEGVYASNFWFGPEDNFSYPARYLYAPPLLPAVIEWTMIIASLCGIKPTGFIPIIPCLIAGIAMIPSIWWVCRRWFGPVAGLTSAWLVATSDFHASYSRAALTDVPVTLFILWAVYFIERTFAACAAKDVLPNGRDKQKSNRGLVTLPWRNIFLAGFFTALAWWTKYNGWLPLAIGLAGGTLWQLLTPRNDRQISRICSCWLLIATLAIFAWSPVLWGLQIHGGYSAVASNHRKYVVGFGSDGFKSVWASSAWRQLKNVGLYENPLDIFYGPFQNRQYPGEMIPFRPDLYFNYAQSGGWRHLVAGLRDWAFTSVTPLLVPLASLVLSAMICLMLVFQCRQSSLRLSICVIATWFAGLTLATPFYYPYPRLVLPWLCSTWICIGLGVEIWLRRSYSGSEKPGSGLRFSIFKVAVLSMALSSAARLMSGSAFAWSDRTCVLSTARQFAADIRKEAASSGFSESEAVVYVMGDPALFFGLKAEGLPAVGPVQGLGFMQSPAVRPTFVAFPSRDSAMSVDDRELLSSYRFEFASRMQELPSHLVLFDEMPRPMYLYSRPESKLFRFVK